MTVELEIKALSSIDNKLYDTWNEYDSPGYVTNHWEDFIMRENTGIISCEYVPQQQYIDSYTKVIFDSEL